MSACKTSTDISHPARLCTRTLTSHTQRVCERRPLLPLSELSSSRGRWGGFRGGWRGEFRGHVEPTPPRKDDEVLQKLNDRESHRGGCACAQHCSPARCVCIHTKECPCPVPAAEGGVGGQIASFCSDDGQGEEAISLCIFPGGGGDAGCSLLVCSL